MIQKAAQTGNTDEQGSVGVIAQMQITQIEFDLVMNGIRERTYLLAQSKTIQLRHSKILLKKSIKDTS
jgi:hypothetical protein